MRDMGKDDNNIHRTIRAHLAICKSFGSTGDGSAMAAKWTAKEGLSMSVLVLHMYPVSVHLGRKKSEGKGGGWPSGPWWHPFWG